MCYKHRFLLLLLLAFVTFLVWKVADVPNQQTSPSLLGLVQRPLSDSAKGIAPNRSDSLYHDEASQKFAPLRLAECIESAPYYYAPCFAKALQNVVLAEEVVYPAFQLSPPVFAPSRPRDREEWWKLVRTVQERAYRLGERLIYHEQHGQVFVFENVTLDPDIPFDKWSQKACMGYAASTSSVRASKDTPTHETLMLANFPDSWSIQHFLDRGAQMLAQGRRFHAGHVLTGRQGHQSVHELWAALGYRPETILRTRTDIIAEQLIWSCRTPHVHPWLVKQFVEMLSPRLQAPASISDRKVVLYMTRSNSHPVNGGRKILNEEELLASVEDLLDRRSQGERLMVFDHTNFTDVESLIQFFQQNVRGIIGPHGGALANHYWAPSDTLILEMQPDTWPALSYYELSKLREQQYAITMLQGKGESGTDMVADIDAVIELLDGRLGTSVPSSERILLHYSWEAEELRAL